MENKNNFKNSKGLFVDTYDSLFSLNEQIEYFGFFKNCIYKINGTDDETISENNEQIYSYLSKDDLSNLKFCNTRGFNYLNEIYNFTNRKIKQIRVNCVTPLEFNDVHTDRSGITLLYFPNIKWNIFWGGHTVFLNDEVTEIEKIAVYKGGRVVVFDGTIPHSITPISLKAKNYRFSFVMQFSDL